jgi:DNA-binding NtrC family response regulator
VSDLAEAVAQRRFREDLYFRLKVVSIDLPPLRERVSDVPLMVEAFVRELAERHGTRVRGVSPEVMRVLQAQPWPGNVRELRNVIESMVVTGSGEVLQISDLPPALREGGAEPPPADAGLQLAGRTAAEVEREHIRATLEKVDGNRARAARMMGIGERTLYRKIKEYGLS